jgi:hypothetical protein
VLRTPQASHHRSLQRSIERALGAAATSRSSPGRIWLAQALAKRRLVAHLETLTGASSLLSRFYLEHSILATSIDTQTLNHWIGLVERVRTPGLAAVGEISGGTGRRRGRRQSAPTRTSVRAALFDPDTQPSGSSGLDTNDDASSCVSGGGANTSRESEPGFFGDESTVIYAGTPRGGGEGSSASGGGGGCSGVGPRVGSPLPNTTLVGGGGAERAGSGSPLSPEVGVPIGVRERSVALVLPALSQSYCTSSELEKENAHFDVVEALIQAIEETRNADLDPRRGGRRWRRRGSGGGSDGSGGGGGAMHAQPASHHSRSLSTKNHRRTRSEPIRWPPLPEGRPFTGSGGGVGGGRGGHGGHRRGDSVGSVGTGGGSGGGGSDAGGAGSAHEPLLSLAGSSLRQRPSSGVLPGEQETSALNGAGAAVAEVQATPTPTSVGGGGGGGGGGRPSTSSNDSDLLPLSELVARRNQLQTEIEEMDKSNTSDQETILSDGVGGSVSATTTSEGGGGGGPNGSLDALSATSSPNEMQLMLQQQQPLPAAPSMSDGMAEEWRKASGRTLLQPSTIDVDHFSSTSDARATAQGFLKSMLVTSGAARPSPHPSCHTTSSVAQLPLSPTCYCGNLSPTCCNGTLSPTCCCGTLCRVGGITIVATLGRSLGE